MEVLPMYILEYSSYGLWVASQGLGPLELDPLNLMCKQSMSVTFKSERTSSLILQCLSLEYYG